MKHNPKRSNIDRGPARQRLLDAAYSLFSSHGLSQVGVDKVIAQSGCAKASLYHHFGSKDGLAVAFLERRREVWTESWLKAGIEARANSPEERLLSIFDLFDAWFKQAQYEGCSFINVLLEAEPDSTVYKAAVEELSYIRKIIREYAEEAGLADTDRFARTWHILMKGSIVAAGEGITEAASDAKTVAEAILNGWPRASG